MSAEMVDETTDLAASYRAVSKAAVVALVLTVLGVPATLSPNMLWIPLLGLIFGLLALALIRRHPDELSGRGAARFAAVLSSLLLVGGIAYHSYVYATEVPDGFERISFADLQPDGRTRDPIPEFARELNGRRVFVKGYVHPGVAGLGEIDNFILVPDLGTCCFGGQPALTDMIEVKIVNDTGIRYNQRKRRLAGTFKINPHRKKFGKVEAGYYELVAEYVN